MRHHRAYLSFPRGHAAYPVFEAEGESEAAMAARMNGFFTDFAQAAKAAAGASPGMYTADYTLSREGEEWRIRYSLKRKLRGRIQARKNLHYRWRGGYLIPPERRRKGAKKRE